MDFSGGGNPVISDGIRVSSGGNYYESTTSISDNNGDFVFGVVGDNVYDGGQNAVFSLPSKTWDAAQGSLIFPKPGTNNQFYLTVMPSASGSGTSGAPNYYTVTVSGPAATGNITVNTTGNLAANLTEAQAGCPKLDAVTGDVLNTYWLLTHEKCTNNFKLYSVTNANISLARTIAAGTALTCSAPTFDEIGVIKFNSCYTQFAYVIGNKVMLFDFDATDGDITFKNQITTVAQPYGVEFSPNGQYLYVLKGQDNNNAGELFRFTISPTTGLSAANSLGLTGGSRGGHLQLAPDKKIYYTIPGANVNAGIGKIGRIDNPDAGGTALNSNVHTARADVWTPTTIYGQTVMMDLPNFLKSFVSTVAELNINGSNASTVAVCQGDVVNFSIKIGGSTTVGVTWTASGANSKTQSNTTSFSVTMLNSGLTKIDVVVTDECGREKTLSYDVTVNPSKIANATEGACSGTKRLLTGTGTGITNFAWYTSNPASGGTLLGIGTTYNANAGTAVWVEPIGSSSGTSTDSRVQNGWNTGSGNTSINNSSTTELVKINSFTIDPYTNGTYSGAFTVELRNGATVVGTPVTQNSSGSSSSSPVITFSPTDWVIPANSTYTVVVTAVPSGALFGDLNPNSSTNNGITYTGGRTVGFNITKYGAASCKQGTLVNVTSCCVAPTNGVSITQTGSPYLICGTSGTLNGTIGGTLTGLRMQWFNGTTAIGSPAAATATPSLSVTADGTYYLRIASTDAQLTSSTCSKAASLTVNIEPVPATPTAGSNSPVCVGSAINLTAPTVSGATYAWTGPGGFTSSAEDPSRASSTSAMAGTYSVTVTVNGCTSTAGTTTVVVNTIPAAPTAGSNSPICAGSTLNLTSNTVSGATYAWTGPGGYTASVEDPTRASATSAMSGTYSVTVTVNGCTSTAGTTNVVVNPIPATPSVSSNSPICVGSTLNLSGPTVSGATYAWTGPGGFTSAVEDPTRTSVTAAMSGTYSLTVTVNGCTSTAGTTNVVINTIPVAPTAGSNSPICAGSTLNLTSNTVAGGTYAWTGPGGYTAAVEDPTRASATTAMSGTYSVTVTVNGCISTAGTTNVVINPIPATPSVSSNSPICVGSTLNLSGPTVAGATYAWTGPGGYTSAVEDPSRTSATAAMSGTYSLTVTVNGCTSIAGTTNVVVNTIPSASITTSGAGLEYCSNGTGVSLTASPVTGATYEWSDGGPFTSTGGSNVKPGATAGSWVVRVTTNGCSATSTPVTVVSVPATTITTQPSNVGTCSGSNATFTVAASGTGLGYEWYGPSGKLVNNTKYSGVSTATLSLTNVAAGDAGDYYVIVTSSGPCADVTSSVAKLTITTTETPTISLSASPTRVCSGSSVTFTATGGGTGTGPVYVFYDAVSNNPLTGGTQTNPGAGQSTYTVTLTGDKGVYVKMTSNSSCVLAGFETVTSSTVNVTVDQAPTTSVAGTNASICSNGTTLAGNQPTVGTGKWTIVSVPAGASVSFVNDALYNTAVNGLSVAGAYEFKWTISNGTCTASESNVTITNVGSVTTPAAGTDATICETQTSYTLQGNSAGAGETGTWSMVSSLPAGGTASFGNANSPSSSVSFSQAGTYTLRWTISNGVCNPSPSDEVILKVDQVPTASVAGTNASICSAGTTLAGNQPTVGTGKWTIVSVPAGATVSFVNDALYNTAVNGLSVAGAYEFKWTISNGTCTASESNVTITNVGNVTTPAAGTDATICETQTSYTLQGNSAGAGETGTWSMVSSLPAGGTASFGNANSASSSVSFSQAGTYTLRWTISNGICSPSPSDEVVLKVDQVPTASVAGTNESICADFTTLAGNQPTVGTGKWAVVSAPAGATVSFVNEASNTTTVNGLTAAGAYVLSWTISNGTCTASTTTVTITNVGNITTPAAGTDATICETQSTYTLQGNTPAGGETGTWSIVSGPGAIAAGTENSPSATLNVTGAGVIVARWTISNGICTSSPSDDVTITIGESVDVAGTTVTIPNPAVCEGSVINLTVTPSQSAIKYQAYVNGNTASAQLNGNNVGLLLPVDAGKVKPGMSLEVRAEGCDTKTFPVTVSVLGRTTGITINGAGKVCGGEASAVPYNITPVAGATDYQWSVTPTTVTVTSGSASTVANFNGISSPVPVNVTISVQPSIGTTTCDAPISKVVNWRPAYNGVTIDGKEPKVCINETISLSLSGTNASGFSWVPSDVNAVKVNPTSLFSADVQFTRAGTYSVNIAPSASPCKVLGDSIVTVVVYDLPIANAGNDDYLENYATVNLDGSGSSQGPEYTYNWTSPNANPGIANPNVISTTATPKGLNTTYFITVGYADPALAGCSSIDDKVVIIDLKVMTPNVFSPNGDGVHDKFELPNIEIFPKAVLYIYNQWGEHIFTSEPGYTNPWDGRRSGKMCTVGTYYYVLELNEEGYKPVTGAVSIVK